MIGIDLGSNTLRVVQIDCNSGEMVAIFEKIVKTADGLIHTGKIGVEAQNRVIDAISEAKRQIGFDGDRYRAVTTEAIRQASNRDEVLARIERETGIVFEIISGEEEAKLTLLAVKHRLQLLGQKEKGSKNRDKKASFLLVDIGGGSTELIFDYQGKVVSKSFPVGIVTVSQRYHTLDVIGNVLPGLMREMQDFCDECYHIEGKVEKFVATAGTPTTVAALKIGQNYTTYDPEVVNGISLQVGDLDEVLERLLGMSDREREAAVGVGRSDLITAGILIFRQLFLIAEMQECIVIDDGLREGVALDSCNRTADIEKKIRF